jgi:hypothetical protein
VLAQVALQLGNGFAAQAGDNGFGVAGIHMLIECLFRVHQHQRPGGAGAHAAGAADEHILALRLGGLDQRILQLVRVLAQAGQVPMQTLTS